MSKVLIDRSVVEQALEDMEMTINYVQSPTRREDMRDSIEALRAALEQEKSPQNASSALQASCEVPQVTDQTEHFHVREDMEVYCTKQPQVEQEPAIYPEEAFDMGLEAIPYYPHQQPPRQPLTEEQILNFGPGQPDAVWSYEDQLYFARAIERAHGITGEQE